MPRPAAPVERIDAAAFVIPTDAPESDGTFEWRATTLVTVTAAAGGREGLGYTYADAPTAQLVADTLAPVVRGRDALAVPEAHALPLSAHCAPALHLHVGCAL